MNFLTFWVVGAQIVFEFSKIIGTLITPPAVIVALALFGLALQLRWRRVGYGVTVFAIFSLLVLSVPWVGYWLMATIEPRNDSIPPSISGGELADRAEAIVVLGGGRYESPLEYPEDTVAATTLVRLRYAANLHRRTGLPVLVSGGLPFGQGVPEAETMAEVLAKEFQVATSWIESESRNTAENARLSAEILHTAGIERVLLVTHAFHMTRARWAFEEYDLRVIPAPTTYTTLGDRERGIMGLLPNSNALNYSAIALKEIFGLLWYRWRYGEPEIRASTQTDKSANNLSVQRGTVSD